MPTEIVSTEEKQYRLDQLSEEQSFEILQNLSANLIDKNGRPKNGTLNVVKRGGRWEIRRQSLWSRFWNYGLQTSLGPEKSAAVIRQLIQQAGNKLSITQTEQVLRLLDGSHGVDASALAPRLGPTAFQREAHRNEVDASVLIQRGGSERKLMDQLKIGSECGSLKEFLDQNRLGKGAFGGVAPLPESFRPGSSWLLKLEDQPIEITTGKEAPLRQREISAAYLQSIKTGQQVPGVVAPSHFLFRDNKEYYHLVPANCVKAFIQQFPARRTLSYLGQVMPRVEGGSLMDRRKEQKDQGGLPPEERREIAGQLHQRLTSMAVRGFVHHDLKPENMMWNPGKKQLTLIDTGMLEKTSRDPQSEYRHARLFGGTRSTASPLIPRKTPHTSAVDGFSAAMVLLSLSVEPPKQKGEKNLFKAIVNEDAANRRLTNPLLEKHKDGYLLAWLSTLIKTGYLSQEEYKNYVERVGSPEVRDDPEKCPATLENYCHQLMQASFLPLAQYKERLQSLEKHPYLLDVQKEN